MPTSAPIEIEGFDPEALLGVLSEVKGGDFTAPHARALDGDRRQDRRRPERDHRRQPGAPELERVSRVVGREGRLSQRASFRGTNQVWGNSIESVNDLTEDLVRPSKEMQRVIGAVAHGDLSKKVSVVQGEMLLVGEGSLVR